MTRTSASAGLSFRPFAISSRASSSAAAGPEPDALLLDPSRPAKRARELDDRPRRDEGTRQRNQERDVELGAGRHVNARRNQLEHEPSSNAERAEYGEPDHPPARHTVILRW